LLFIWVNLYRYATAGSGRTCNTARFDMNRNEVGAVHVDSPRPIAERRLVPRWFQPTHLSSEKLVSRFAFQKCNAHRYNEAVYLEPAAIYCTPWGSLIHTTEDA
jgi:hypothetical protein